MVETETTGEPGGRDRIGAIERRWPSALAVLLAAAIVFGGERSAADTVGGFGEALLLLPLGYLAVAKLENRRLTWPVMAGVLVAMTLLMTVLGVATPIPPAAAFAAVALAVLLWGALGERPEDKRMFAVQAVGLAGFAALALTGLALDPELGRYVVAAGWFLHGVWDFVHFRLDKVVARSYAECCGIFDILVAAVLVLQPL
ncbi:hypothetical protein [Spirillospora sp. NPDC029432]|uniref:hypothetical protein n=1 Tax=Spirillospora sp. NPDC029432 TaxID=3154599 RepID=UPI003452D0CE